MSFAWRGVVWPLVFVVVFTGGSFAHDDKFENDREPAYDGPGYRQADGGTLPVDFDSRAIDLLSWIPISEFNLDSFSASDCWGYTSESGREYAIIGLYRGTAFVEITDPTDARVIDKFYGDQSFWQDIKVYDHFAYSVTEPQSRIRGGIRVFDLDRIDEGIVTFVTTVTTGGITSRTHNIAIDSDSAFLYRVGGGIDPTNGLRIYSLADPAHPAFVNAWRGRYVHDAQVVTYTEGTYAGKQVAFCFANDTAGGVNPGVDILDVTDKGHITTLSSINLAAESSVSHPAAFSHQGWLSPDRHYLYFGDEIDEGVYPYPPTTTRVIDVSDLSNPVLVAAFSNGGTARDHNIYTVDDLIFEANYRSGLRIFDARDPQSPVEIAYFDTYPPDDAAAFNSLWSVYPFFPSGTIIGSDIEKGLFVWRFHDCRATAGSSTDCNGNGVSDGCDISEGTSGDCDDNLRPDECDIADGLFTDLNGDGVPDECCNADGDCDDGNPCTLDTCAKVCAYLAIAGACEDDLYCNGTSACVDGSCVPSDPPCTDSAKPLCDEANDRCVVCLSNQDCDNGVFCDGSERCSDGVCSEGADPCPNEICDQNQGRCVGCVADSACDDGRFCNGVEVCDEAGRCGPGSPPCSADLTCDEQRDACVCTANEDCIDGLFCNGAETCDGTTGLCTSGTAPCAATGKCDEYRDSCTECLVGADCDDGNPCTADRCPHGTCTNTPLAGCADRDLDGIRDAADYCPGTAWEVPVDARGCSCNQLDDDHDGIDNCRDTCADTAAGEFSDKNGCSQGQIATKSPEDPAPEPDRDDDGVPDLLDMCADTPVEEAAGVDADGCSHAQLADRETGQQIPDDGDADGIPDAVDQCPDTLPDQTAEVDAEGCSGSQRDTDGDGVPDIEDQCGNTASGEAVDDDGCAPATSGGSDQASRRTRAPCGMLDLMILAFIWLGLSVARVRYSIRA